MVFIKSQHSYFENQTQRMKRVIRSEWHNICICWLHNGSVTFISWHSEASFFSRLLPKRLAQGIWSTLSGGTMILVNAIWCDMVGRVINYVDVKSTGDIWTSLWCLSHRRHHRRRREWDTISFSRTWKYVEALKAFLITSELSPRSLAGASVLLTHRFKHLDMTR